MSDREAGYRLKLSQGFLEEARQDLAIARWRSAVDNADYGDEVGGRTPWELFTESDARQAVEAAEEAVGLTRGVIQDLTS